MQTNISSTAEVKGANVIDFRSASAPDKSEYIQAIHAFCDSMADALSPKEFGSLSMLARLDVQRKTIVVQLARYYRIHRTADVAPGVFAMITILTDNDAGIATITEPAMAELFGRSENAIHEARKRLKADRMIETTRGRYAGSHPVIPRAISKSYNHLVWTVEAMKGFNPPATQGDCQSPRLTGGLTQSPCHTGRLNGLNPPVESSSIPLPHGGLFLSKNSSKEKRKNTPIVPKDGDDASDNAFGVSAAIATIVAAMGVAAIPAAAFPTDVAAVVQSATQALTQVADEKPPAKKRAPSKAGEYTHDFDEFWKIYPRAVGKGAAFKSWQRLTMDQKRKAYRALKDQLAALTAQATDSRGNFCPHPATWINQGRFDDDAPKSQQTKTDPYDIIFRGVQ